MDVCKYCAAERGVEVPTVVRRSEEFQCIEHWNTWKPDEKTVQAVEHTERCK